tara:strand:- start:1541 stop:2635 length:1095 start_codon:yes stop_codon:yes gene_type:complete
MFGETYEYRTSLSNLMVLHIKKKIKYLKKNIFFKRKLNILDIGSNDGTFLNNFSKSNNLIGVDPSVNKFKKFYKKNVHICNEFFSKKNLDSFIKRKKININKFDLITSFAMFYDVDDPNSFCKDISISLKNNGIWMLELSYLPLMLKNLTYDQICHEHVGYYTLTSFKNIIQKYQIKIIDVSFNEINGGSVEIICAKNNSKFKTNNKKINKVLLEEKKIKDISYKNFNLRINEVRINLQKFIKLNTRKKIIGYGASTKGNVVLNHCKIKKNQIEYICDGSDRKRGRYTPGTNIKIISKQKMREMKPKYLLVLIWSFRREVIKQELNFLKKGGELVFHLPRFHIVNLKNYKFFLKNDFQKLSYNY